MSKKINFEESLKRLEEITGKLENGEFSLDESLKFFEEGIKLSRFCEMKLSEVEQKLEILKSTDISDEEFLNIDDIYSDDKNDTEKPKKKKTKEIKSNDENLLF